MNQPKKIKSICIIGGGFYGCYIAKKIKENFKDIKIEINEKNTDLIAEAGKNNQYRLHLGFHYPRSLQTIKHKQMQNVSVEDNIFTPLNSNLAATVQDPVHIIQEQVNRTWVRGGIPSRQSVKDADYFANSGDNSRIKAMLRNSKRYL